MWKNNYFAAYIRAKRDMEVLFFGILALEAVIYSLYGLPWGPSFYTMILSAALFFLIWGLGYASYRKKCIRLIQMQEKEEIESNYFPKTTDKMELLYQELESVKGRGASTMPLSRRRESRRMPTIRSGAIRSRRRCRC